MSDQLFVMCAAATELFVGLCLTFGFLRLRRPAECGGTNLSQERTSHPPWRRRPLPYSWVIGPTQPPRSSREIRGSTLTAQRTDSTVD
jgi:hypothetical protein